MWCSINRNYTAFYGLVFFVAGVLGSMAIEEATYTVEKGAKNATQKERKTLHGKQVEAGGLDRSQRL